MERHNKGSGSLRLAAATLSLYGAVVLGGGLAAYGLTGSRISLISATLLSAVLCLLAFRAFKGSVSAGYMGAVCTFLLAIYFAYRFIASERFIPSGILLIVSFAALFGVTLGVFLGLQRHS